MTTQTITINVQLNGQQAAVGGIKAVGDQAARSSSAVDMFRAALGALTGALAINKLREYADTYLGLEGRLKIVTKSQQEFTKAQQDLLKIANTTRSSLEGTTNLYTKLALQQKELRINTRDIAEVVKTVNQAMIISGASANEARGGLIQFAQGLSSGKLQGEELRSVLENLPRLAKAIADGMGTTIGQLRTLGASGQLTTQAIIAALKKQGRTIEQEFAKMPITVGQALQVLENQWISFFGRTSQESGVIKVITDLILKLSENLGVAANALGILAAGWAAFKAVGITQSLFQLAAGASLLASPFTLLIAIFAAFSTWALTMGANLKITENGTLTYGQAIMNLVNTIGSYLKPAFDWVLTHQDLVAKGFIALGVALVAALGTQVLINVITSVKTLTTALWAMSAAAWANPYMLLGAAIVAATAALGYFIVQSGVLDSTFRVIGQVGQLIWKMIAFTIEGAGNAIKWVSDNLQYLDGWITQVGTNIVGFFKDSWNSFFSWIDEKLQLFVKAFNDAVNKIGEFFGKIFSKISSYLDPIIKKVMWLIEKGQSLLSGKMERGDVETTGSLPGFATGGSFTVGGSGGTDSKVVAFKATPGEQVTVETPSQQFKSLTINNQTDFEDVLSSKSSLRGFDEVTNKGSLSDTSAKTASSMVTVVEYGKRTAFVGENAWMGQLAYGKVDHKLQDDQHKELQKLTDQTYAQTDVFKDFNNKVGQLGTIMQQNYGAAAQSQAAGSSVTGDFSTMGNDARPQGTFDRQRGALDSFSGSFGAGSIASKWGGTTGSFTMSSAPLEGAYNMTNNQVETLTKAIDFYSQLIPVVEAYVSKTGSVPSAEILKPYLLHPNMIPNIDPKWLIGSNAWRGQGLSTALAEAGYSVRANPMAPVLGFRYGGSMEVSGEGGPDSKLLQMKVSPGERVTVQTPSQQREEDNARRGGSQRPIQVFFNIKTDDADSFNRSKNQVLQDLGGAITRAMRSA